MISTILVQVFSLLNLFLIIFIKIYRKSKRSFDGDIYNIILGFGIASVVTDIVQLLAINLLPPESLGTKVVIRFNLSCAILYTFFILAYTMSINSNKGYNNINESLKNEKNIKYGLILVGILLLVLWNLDPKFVTNEATGIKFQYGAPLLYSFCCVAFFGLIEFIYLVINPRKINVFKLLPIYIFEFLGICSMIIQWLYPTILLISAVMSFITLFLYFTNEQIENKGDNEVLSNDNNQKVNYSNGIDFLVNMSHDIRTPMNVIMGYSEALLTEPLRDKQREEVKNIYEASTNLLSVINNVIDISRIESGEEIISKERYNFKSIVDKASDAINPEIDSRRVQYNIQLANNIPKYLIGDENKIYQILYNLLSNAAKYTKEGSISLNISASIEGEIANLRIIIKDTGIGIKESDYNKIFDKFVRLETPELNKNIDGSGLGLTITKKLVDLLEGTITLTSKYQEGSIFTVELPQKIAQLGEDNQDEETAIINYDGSNYSILVVDDNELNLKVMERILSDYKFDVELINNGLEAIEIIKSGRKFDMIFVDDVMNEISGTEILTRLKELKNISDLPPIIVTTANVLNGQKEKYLSDGFDDYIKKPIERKELARLINKILKKEDSK